MNREYLDSLERKLEEAELSNQSLFIDLFDHVCCMVEERLSQGIPYKVAEEQVFEAFEINQIRAIEAETLLLTKNHMIMKKRTLVTGVISLVIMVVAFFLEVSLLKGGPLLMFLGAFIGVFGFGTQVIFDRFSYTKSTRDRLKTVIGFIGAGFLLSGIAFHFTAWPFGISLIMIGGIVLFTYFIVDNLFSARANVSI